MNNNNLNHSDDKFDADFNKTILHALNQQADYHPKQREVSQRVFAQLDVQRQHKYQRIGFGFALAAAIMGVAVLPSALTHPPAQQQQMLTNTKLSPQLAEDLEMLMVLGEDHRGG